MKALRKVACINSKMTDKKKIEQACSRKTLSSFVDLGSKVNVHELLCFYSRHDTCFAREPHFFHLHCRAVKAQASEETTSGNRRSRTFLEENAAEQLRTHQ